MLCTFISLSLIKCIEPSAKSGKALYTFPLLLCLITDTRYPRQWSGQGCSEVVVDLYVVKISKSKFCAVGFFSMLAALFISLIPPLLGPS